MCTPGDAAALSATVKEYLSDSDYIPKEPSEFAMTVAQAEGWIQSFIDKENSLLLVAVHEERIIGNIDLTGSPRKAMQHTAMIGMGMLAEWRSVGLGTALMNAAVGWATANTLLELLWLQVYTANTAALALYKKFQFTEAGLVPGYFVHNGRYYDNLTMYRSVK